MKKKSKTTYFGDKWAEFCRTTDLHGYKYIVMPGLSLKERMFWVVVVMLCMGTAGYLVVTAWRWYSRNPTVTVIESTHGAIWDVPFPAITICNLNMVSKRAARRFADSLNIITPNITADDVFALLRFTPLFSGPYRIDSVIKNNMSMLQTILDHNNISIDELFRNLNPSPCNRLIQRCVWKNTMYQCDALFRPVITHYTNCCAFNYYAVDTPPALRNSSTDDPFRPVSPRRVASCGYQSALTVLINIEPEDYYSTAFASYGVLVFVDSAYNVPDRNSPVRLINPQTEVFVAISPERTYATKGISSFPVDVRECLFNNEEPLGLFKEYSYHNCLIFRKSEQLLEFCGCIPHYMPKNESVRSCNFNDISCMQIVQESMRKGGLQDTGSPGPRECLPDCEHFSYPLEVAVGYLARLSPLNGLAFFKDVTLRNHSMVNIFFNDLVSTRFRRDVYLNWQNLLASFGGLLGLLLGFTLISGVDFIIFVLFRLLCNTDSRPVSFRTTNQDLRNMKDFYQRKPNKVGPRTELYAPKRTWKPQNLKYNSKNMLKVSSDPPKYEDTHRY